MSEYQYYEFQAIDRPLTEDEQAEIAKLSSRVALTSTQAIFTYHFGDLPARAEKILERYFGALLYTTNWGTRRLMFRFQVAHHAARSRSVPAPGGGVPDATQGHLRTISNATLVPRPSADRRAIPRIRRHII